MKKQSAKKSSNAVRRQYQKELQQLPATGDREAFYSRFYRLAAESENRQLQDSVALDAAFAWGMFTDEAREFLDRNIQRGEVQKIV